MIFRFLKPKNLVADLLRKHFAPLQLEQIITAGRRFPVTSRVDLQRALDRIFASDPEDEQG